jgi:hypothetical protein
MQVLDEKNNYSNRTPCITTSEACIDHGSTQHCIPIRNPSLSIPSTLPPPSPPAAPSATAPAATNPSFFIYLPQICGFIFRISKGHTRTASAAAARASPSTYCVLVAACVQRTTREIKLCYTTSAFGRSAMLSLSSQKQRFAEGALSRYASHHEPFTGALTVRQQRRAESRPFRGISVSVPSRSPGGPFRRRRRCFCRQQRRSAQDDVRPVRSCDLLHCGWRPHWCRNSGQQRWPFLCLHWFANHSLALVQPPSYCTPFPHSRPSSLPPPPSLPLSLPQVSTHRSRVR